MLEQPGTGWQAENKARPFVGVLPLEPGSMFEPVELGRTTAGNLQRVGKQVVLEEVVVGWEVGGSLQEDTGDQ